MPRVYFMVHNTTYVIPYVVGFLRCLKFHDFMDTDGLVKLSARQNILYHLGRSLHSQNFKYLENTNHTPPSSVRTTDLKIPFVHHHY